MESSNGNGHSNGRKKPEGSGRKKGSLNKVTTCIREAAQEHGPVAIRVLVNLMMNHQSGGVRIAAAKEILDRAYGKSRQAIDLGGNLNLLQTIILEAEPHSVERNGHAGTLPPTR